MIPPFPDKKMAALPGGRAALLLGVDIGIERILGDPEIPGDLVAGFGHQKRAVLVEELDGFHLVILVHQRHRLSNQRHRLLNQVVNRSLTLMIFSGSAGVVSPVEIRSWMAPSTIISREIS